MSQILINEKEKEQLQIELKSVNMLQGDVAEVGTYAGDSAKAMAQVTNKTIHCFDTWTGIPEISAGDSFTVGQFAISIDECKENLKGYNNIKFYQGVFPKSAGRVSNKTFCFVFLDCDTFKSIHAGLMFFYPRMHKGGKIMIHDYLPDTHENNVNKAIKTANGDLRALSIMNTDFNMNCKAIMNGYMAGITV